MPAYKVEIKAAMWEKADIDRLAAEGYETVGVCTYDGEPHLVMQKAEQAAPYPRPCSRI